jgi:hypothetical protein
MINENWAMICKLIDSKKYLDRKELDEWGERTIQCGRKEISVKKRIQKPCLKIAVLGDLRETAVGKMFARDLIYPLIIWMILWLSPEKNEGGCR